MASQVSRSATQIPEAQRWRYGIRMMEILATNNSSDSCLHEYISTWPVSKMAFTVRNPDFESLYETKILNAVTQVLRSSLPNACQWALHVLRLGFHQNQMDNPIIIHLLVAHGCLSDNDAFSVVEKIEGAISTAQWRGEPVYVDVCQRVASAELRSTSNEDSKKPVNVRNIFSEQYSYIPPLPGFSIGPKDRPGWAGSFSGFIKHTGHTDTKVFGLTCDHVLNGSESSRLISSGEYRYEVGQKFAVTMPAKCDHDETTTEISTRRQEATERKETALKEKDKKMNVFPGSSTKAYDVRYNEAAMFENHYLEIEQQIKDYNIEVGHVYSLSGQDTSGAHYAGCLDWGMFDARFSTVKNKHPQYSLFDNFSGFHLDPSARDHVTSSLGKDFIEESRDYLKNGPDFKTLRETNPNPDEIFFKVPSRSSGWKDANCNGIKAVLNAYDGSEIREWCFVAHNSSEQVSWKGDSGAPLIDSNYQPTAILWGGNESGFRDVTYVTPIHEILKDIERRLGWGKGSVTFC